MRNDIYFDWLIDIICGHQRPYNNYHDLLWELYSREFTWIIDMDENRASYGNQLREDFEDETGFEACKDGYCSILEMMIALSIHEEEMLYEPGDERPERIFWFMIENLGLHGMTDDEFDYAYVDMKIDIFLNRKYNPDGSGGGLFKVKYPPKDLRKVEIWYQMNWYLSEKDGCDLSKIGGI